MQLRVLFLIFLQIKMAGVYAQSVADARKRLKKLDEQITRRITHLQDIHNDFFANEFPSRSQSYLNHSENELSIIRMEPELSLQKQMEELAIHEQKLFNIAIDWRSDSAIFYRKIAIESGKDVLKAAAWLEHSVSVFCILNKLNKPEDKIRAPAFLREEWKRLEYLLEIQKILFPVIEAERKCLNNFLPDSVSSAEKRRLDFTGLVSIKTQTMKNFPPLKGDRFVKPAALNSLYQFAMEAKNDLPHLEKFLEAEKKFILIHQKSKSAEKLSTEENESYRKAVKKYNADIRAANELVKELQKKRDTHLRAFFAAQQAFLEDNLRVFQE
jgi:hypothetical protein